MEELELCCFQIISNAGGAKSKCFEAIALSQTGDFTAAKQKIIEAKEIFVKAHQVHGELIVKEAAGNAVTMTLLLTHAEDQLMGAELSREFAEQIILLHEKIDILESK